MTVTTTTTTMTEIPIVNYLVLDDGQPYLSATTCTSCAARHLGERAACSRCGARTFEAQRLATTGSVGSFSIIHRAAPAIATPYVSALVDLDDGMTVKANIVDCPPDPEHVSLGMRVGLRVFEAGRDGDGVTAVAFGFAPLPTTGDS